MSYRGPKVNRITTQYTENQLMFAGQTAIWKQFVSSSAANPLLGFGDTEYYREQVITGVFGTPPVVLKLLQQQTPGGQAIVADVTVTTREKLGRKDFLIWNGTSYRVDSDPTPSIINNSYITTLKRGGNS